MPPGKKVEVELTDEEHRAVRLAAADLDLSIRAWARRALVEQAREQLGAEAGGGDEVTLSLMTTTDMAAEERRRRVRKRKPPG